MKLTDQYTYLIEQNSPLYKITIFLGLPKENDFVSAHF